MSGTGGQNENEDLSATYRFKVRFRLAPQTDVRLDPQSFETTLSKPASPAGEEDWLFFRDNLWRGEVNDEPHMRSRMETTLGVPIEKISFRELRTTSSYLDTLKEAITEELHTQPAVFGNATNADDVLKKYLGSSIHVYSPN